jgi:hypothetical protein
MNLNPKVIIFSVVCVGMLTSLTAGRTFALDPFASCDNGACKEKVSASSLDQNNCRSGDVLKGAGNKKDLKILSKCETARGIVHDVHHHMKDGDYKFGLDVEKKYKHLLNKGNDKKRVGGNLIVEIVPKDRKSSDVYLPENGDDVRVWGAWVKDKPNGWNEIHPAWKVVKK